MGLILLIGAGATLACTSDPEFVRAPEERWPFFLIFDGGEAPAGAPTVTGPHDWADDDASFRFGVNGVDRIELLTVDLDSIVRPYRLGDSSPLDGVELRFGAVACGDEFLSNDGHQVSLTANDAKLYSVEGAKLTARPLEERSVSLWFSVTEEECFGAPPLEFSSFAANPRLLDSGLDLEGLGFDPPPGLARLIRPLSDGRALLLLGDRVLVLVGPDEDLRGANNRIWSTAALPPLPLPAARWFVFDFEVLESTDSSDFKVGLLASWFDSTTIGFGGSVLVDLDWTTAGFGPVTARVESELELFFLDLDDAGRWIAGGKDGLIYLRSGAETEYTQFDLGSNSRFGVLLRDWASTGDESEPDLFIDTGATLHFGAVGSGTPFRIEPSPLSKLEGDLLTWASPLGGLEVYWSGGTPEFRHRKASGERELITGYLPDVLASCGDAADDCGRRNFSLGMYMPLAVTPRGTLILGSSACHDLVEYEPSRRCSRAISLGGLSESSGSFGVGSLSASPRGLLVGSNDTLLLFAPWAP